MNIFLAEDNDADVFMIKEALTLADLSYTLIHQSDGQAAIDALRALGETDVCLGVALLDLNLPKRSGHDVISHIRGSKRFKNLPIIVLTSSDSPHDRSTAANNGVNHYFRKPSDIHDFFRLADVVKSLTSTNDQPSAH